MKNIEFAEKYFRAPLYNRQPVELTRYQKALLSNLEQNPKTIIEFSRQSGVSSCLAIHIANFMIHNSNRIIAIVSPYKSAPHLLVKIRVLLEEYRISIGMSENEFYWCNKREKIKVYGGCEVYIHTNMTRYHGSEDVDKVEMLVVDNSAHVKNLDKIEEDFKLQTRVKQIIIANTNENMSQAMRIEKPPIGLVPKEIWITETFNSRFEEVKLAIKRYFDAGLEIPIQWIEELNEFIKINKEI